MASSWWVFIGTLLCFTPLFPVGICLIGWYFISLLFRNGSINTGTQYNENTYNINNLNVNSDSTDDKDDFDTPMDYMSKDSKEEMR